MGNAASPECSGLLLRCSIQETLTCLRFVRMWDVIPHTKDTDFPWALWYCKGPRSFGILLESKAIDDGGSQKMSSLSLQDTIFTGQYVRTYSPVYIYTVKIESGLCRGFALCRPILYGNSTRSLVLIYYNGKGGQIVHALYVRKNILHVFGASLSI